MIGPLHLVTGLPGNGKTLWTICEVKKKAEKENRQVYVHGIEILDKHALPWIEFDAHEWHKLPHGAIIVIDEVHKVFPVRPTGSKAPDHVTPIGELRHSGYDMFIITQHPMELDSAVRRRVTAHLHCVRRMGMQACVVREWPRVIENCDKTDKGTSDQHEWVYNKDAYNWYKSAEIHTIKRKLPAKLLWLLIAPIMLVIAIVFLVQIFNKQRSGEAIKAAATANGGVVATSSSGGTAARSEPFLSRQDYLAQYKPRIPGLLHTAPAYDQVTKPVRVPYPAACIESETRCQCYTSQGTRLDTSIEICTGIARGGFFVDWDEGQGRQQQDRSVRPQLVAQVEPPVVQSSGLGGFNTSRFVGSQPVSVTAPQSQDQSGRARAIAR